MSDYLDTDWVLVDFDEPKKAAPIAPTKPEKGVCHKCGKRVGKGVHFHVMSCDGNPSSAR